MGAKVTVFPIYCPSPKLVAARGYAMHEHVGGKLKTGNWVAFGLSGSRLLERASRSGSRAERAGGCLQPGWGIGYSSEPAGRDYTGMWCVPRAWKGHETHNSHSIICEWGEMNMHILPEFRFVSLTHSTGYLIQWDTPVAFGLVLSWSTHQVS